MDDEYDAEEDGENVIECPSCENLSDHDVLRERKVGSGSDFLVKCKHCSSVHTIQFRPPKIIEVPIMLTEGPKSIIEMIEMEEDEYLSVNVIFAHGEKHWRLTRLENMKGRSVSSLIASEVARATALRADQLRIKITMTEGEDSTPDVIEVPADTTFSAGSIMRHNGRKWRIRAIHTGSGRTLTGKVPAHQIKRLYLHEPPSFTEEAPRPRTGRERRQAWKEGRLGFNPEPISPREEKRGRKK